MIRNYLKIALRSLIRQKAYSLINILGLTVGLGAFLMILLYIQSELGYDKHIPGLDRLYRVVEIQNPPGVGEQHVAVTMSPMKEAIAKDFPEVEKSVRALNWGSVPLIYKGVQYNQQFLTFTDPEIFELFGVELLMGDTATALADPYSIVLSERTAEKIFGSAGEAMGKVLSIESKSGFKVTGIMENQPKETHFRMEALVPFEFMKITYPWIDSWESNSMTTYVRLDKNTDLKNFQEKIYTWLLNYTTDEEDTEETVTKLYLQPVSDIHLRSGHIKFQNNVNEGSIILVYVFLIVAILIIIIACINFINMAIARSFKRAKEVGMRKVLGASRVHLVYRFIGESFIITLISILLSLIVVELMLPPFSRLLNQNFSLDFSNWIFNVGLIGLLVLVSLVAGSYPAFYLSRFQPVSVLKGGVETRSGRSGTLSKALVVFQFIISIALIFSILVINRQFKYALNKDMGLDYTNVVGLRLYDKNTPANMRILQDEFSRIPGVMETSAASDINGVTGTQSTITAIDSTEIEIACRLGAVGYDYFPMMDIPIVEGRNFSRDYALDSVNAVILNQAAVNYLQWEQPLGKVFMNIFDTNRRKVIGVISDYHYYSIHSKIEPAAYVIKPGFMDQIVAKLRREDMQQTVSAMERIWNRILPGVPFELQYADRVLRNQYMRTENALKLFTYFAILSIIVSCLGLFGLTSFVIQQRTKEVGIRKVLGGSVKGIVVLLTRDFVYLVLIAGIIATPIAWYVMDNALQVFAYRINISWEIFVLPVLTALLIAVITIAFKAYSAAVSDPVEAIRYE